MQTSTTPGPVLIAEPGTPPDPRAPRLLRGTPLRTRADFEAVWGRRPRGHRALIDEVGRAEIGGRGGAGFPLAAKLRAVADRGGRTVVVNATEGEPASAKDVTLLRTNPHLVLDGAAIAAEVVGAGDVIVCVASDSGVAGEVERAARERPSHLAVRVEQTPPRYLSGQEMALVSWLNGGPVRPTVAPPRPAERGVGRRPTLVANAETVANLALVARFGADWYRAAGRADATGTRLLTVTGAVPHPGVYEADHGAPLDAVIASVGGDLAASGGVLLGGYFGAWLPAGAGAVPLSDAGLGPWGASIGAGVVVVLPGGHCGVAETARILAWLVAESAGQCGPCRHGLPAIAAAFEAAAAGGGAAAVAEVRRLCGVVAGRGACGLPDGAIRLVRSALDTFGADLEAHARRGPCAPRPAVTPLSPAAGRVAR